MKRVVKLEGGTLRQLEEQTRRRYAAARKRGFSIRALAHWTKVPMASLAHWLKGERTCVRVDRLDQLLKGIEKVEKAELRIKAEEAQRKERAELIAMRGKAA